MSVAVFNLGNGIIFNGRPVYDGDLKVGTYGVDATERGELLVGPVGSHNIFLWHIGDLLGLPEPEYSQETIQGVSGMVNGCGNNRGWVRRDNDRANDIQGFRPITPELGRRFYLHRRDVAARLFGGSRVGSTVIGIAQKDVDSSLWAPINFDPRQDEVTSPGLTILHRRSSKPESYPFLVNTLVGLEVACDIIHLATSTTPLEEV